MPILDSNTPSSPVSGFGASRAIAFPAVAIILLFLVREISDFDMWFHLAVGKEILAAHSLPTTDQLSLLNLGRPVAAHLWLFQVVAAAGYQMIGYWWLHGIQLAALGITLATVFRSTRPHASAGWTWLLLVAVTIASSERFTVRPELVSFIMIAVYYARLQQGKYNSCADLAVFFILQTIWTNSHGIFIIGPFMAGCYLLASLLPGTSPRSRTSVRSLGKLTGITALACIVTPGGWSNIRYSLRLALESNPLAPRISNSTYEMAPALGEISRTLLPFWFYLFLIAAFLLTSLAAICYHRKQLSVARLLIGVSLLAASLTGMKNIPVFALVAAPLIAENLSLLDARPLRRALFAALAVVMTTAAITWSLRPALSYLATWVPYRFGLGISGDYVPLGLPAFLDETGFTGPIFNSMNLGGFYEFHGYPRRIPFYDSRLQDYTPTEVIAAFNTAINASRQPSAWHEMERRFSFAGILLGNPPDDPEAAGLLPLVAADPSWRLVYLDHAASFWMRADRQGAPPAVDEGRIRSLVEAVSNASQAENMNFFLERTGWYRELRRKLLENAAGRWNNTSLLIDLGLLDMQSGDHAGAERLFLRVLRMKPDSRLTLATLAQLALMRNDRTGAEKYIREALRHYPDDADLRQNLDAIINYR